MNKAIIFIAIAAVVVGAVTGGVVYFVITNDENKKENQITEDKEDTDAPKTTVNYDELPPAPVFNDSDSPDC